MLTMEPRKKGNKIRKPNIKVEAFVNAGIA